MSKEKSLGDVPWFKSGAAGWVLLALGVYAWDQLAPESLSAAFAKTQQRPESILAAGVIWGILTAHLFGVMPPQIDPFKLLFASRRNRGVPDAAEMA